MKASLLNGFGMVVLASALVACGGGGGSSTKNDLSISNKDMNVATGDLSVSAGCTKIATFTTDTVTASNQTDSTDPTSFVDSIYGNTAPANGVLQQIYYDFYNPQGMAAPTLPHTVDFSSTDASNTYKNCSDCSEFWADVDPADIANTGTLYFAQGGIVTVTKLDITQPMGTVAASGANMHYVEWDATADAPVANGKCVDVGSFSFSASYDNVNTDM